MAELEVANAKLSQDLASHKLQNTEAQMLQVSLLFRNLAHACSRPCHKCVVEIQFP